MLPLDKIFLVLFVLHKSPVHVALVLEEYEAQLKAQGLFHGTKLLGNRVYKSVMVPLVASELLVNEFLLLLVASS